MQRSTCLRVVAVLAEPSKAEVYQPAKPHAPAPYHRKAAPRNNKGERRPTDLELYNGLWLGQTVLGRVVVSTRKGARVEILEAHNTPTDNLRHRHGWMPITDGPLAVRDTAEVRECQGLSRPLVPVGLIRPFQVKALPTPEAVTGNPNNTAGPLLSAFLHDRRTMWHRGWQLQSCNREDRENVMMRVEGVNGGGLVSRVCGLPIFVPYSQLHKDRDLRYSEEELRERYLGKDIEVAVIEVDMRSQKLVASVSRGLSNSIMRRFHVGHLVEGMVRRIDRNGVFIGIKDTMETGLLHISNVSRKHVPDVSEVFSVGEMVWVMVMGFEPGFGKVSFSTAELEVEDGDIMTNKESCWENREAQQKKFLDHLASLQEGDFNFELFYESKRN
ncbi:hypothetical protein ACKKBG_A13455 [Auxenochlorella protothecoides x Auxenochlorella symbiontica]